MKTKKWLFVLTSAVLAVALFAGVALADSTVVVAPTQMNGWFFQSEGNGNPTTGTMETGPEEPPLGIGSANLALSGSSDHQVLSTQAHAGTPLAEITDLEYSTYRASFDAGNNLAIALQFDVDYDLTDESTVWQGRLVFEPYHTTGGGVTQNEWQTWSPLEGEWWATGGPGSTICPQGNPCTWSEVLGEYPDAGIRTDVGYVHFKAGSSWAVFDGSVDAFTIGVNEANTTYDFEPYVVATTKEQCMDGGWQNVTRADGSTFKNQGDCIQYVNTGK